MAEDLSEIIRRLEIEVLNLRSHVGIEDEKIKSDVRSLTETIFNLKQKVSEMPETYVTSERYKPVEKIVLGGAGLVLIAVITALAALVIR